MRKEQPFDHAISRTFYSCFHFVREHGRNEYGLIGQHAVQLQAKREAQAAKVAALYQGTVYPASLVTANRILQNDPTVLDDIMRDDVIGRIMPLGTFNDKRSSAEYFYGLTNPPDPSLAPTITAVEQISGPNCDNNECWVYNRFFLADPLTGQNFNLTHYGAFYFDEPRETDSDQFGRVCAYDISFRRLQHLDYLKVYGPLVDPTGSLPKEQVIQIITGLIADQVCQIEKNFCTGANDQYASYAHCMGSLLQVPLGGWVDGDQNSLHCYQLHSTLAAFDPNSHCKHIGPADGSSGRKCYDKPNASYFDVDYTACKAQDAELGNPARAA